MATLEEYYLYAKLATAAYIPLENIPEVTGATLAAESNNLERLPGDLAN